VLVFPFFTDDTASFYLEETARAVNEFPTARRSPVGVGAVGAQCGSRGGWRRFDHFHATFTAQRARKRS